VLIKDAKIVHRLTFCCRCWWANRPWATVSAAQWRQTMTSRSNPIVQVSQVSSACPQAPRQTAASWTMTILQLLTT